MQNDETVTAVAVEPVEGTWVVRITEGGVTQQREFEVADHARSFAEGQRIRLGLPAFSE